jgi:undecaprenyl-diphosphatase
MPEPHPREPVEEGLARRLGDRRVGAGAGSSREAAALLHGLARFDRAVYRWVAEANAPLLDEPLRRVSDFANFSKPWFLAAGVLALFGGARGRRAAVTGLAAVGTTSLVVNQPLKRAGERRRPDREGLGVPPARWVRMPSSTSFPSGHSASAAAFAVAVGDVLPRLRVPLRAAALVVAFSRVYTGVHYPSDVVAGMTAGALLGRLVSRAAHRFP